MKKFIVLAMLLCPFFSIGQTINGRVINKKDKGIQDVYIMNIRNSSHTHTDNKGNFNLSDFRVGDTLILSHIQYKEKTVIINTLHLKEGMKIYIEARSLNLSEITITNKLNSLL